VTNAPLADITTESLFSFDLKNREEIIEYRKLKYKLFLITAMVLNSYTKTNLTVGHFICTYHANFNIPPT
jgi:hypothetical protein